MDVDDETFISFKLDRGLAISLLEILPKGPGLLIEEKLPSFEPGWGVVLLLGINTHDEEIVDTVMVGEAVADILPGSDGLNVLPGEPCPELQVRLLQLPVQSGLAPSLTSS